jgi:hypothetical protein
MAGRVANIYLKPLPKTQTLEIISSDLRDDTFRYCIPEAIGSTGGALWMNTAAEEAEIHWEEPDPGVFRYAWQRAGVLWYSVTARARDGVVEVEVKVKNLGTTAWPASLSFSCLQVGATPSFADYDGTRTMLLVDDRWTPITQLPRRDSPRPTLQLWYLKGGARDLPFVEKFKATSSALPAGVIAVQSYDRSHVVALTADRPLFLFGNLEYGCIHCCPNLGTVQPGQVGTATHKVIIGANTTLEALRARL